MKRACAIFSLMIFATAGGCGWALEGTLNKDKKEATENGVWNFTGNGAWTLNNILIYFNGVESVKNRCKIGVDMKLASKTVSDFKIDPSISVLAAMEKLAKAAGAKLYAINGNFLYIANDLPSGFTGRAPAPKTDPKPGPAKPVAAPEAPPEKVGMSALQVNFPNCQVGWSSIIPWSRVNFDDAKKDARPKVLFIFDDDNRIEANNTGHFFETLLLEDPEVFAALKGFSFIKIAASDRAMNWPDGLLDAAKMPESVKTVPKPSKPPAKDARPVTNPASSNCVKGACLYLLKPDGSPAQIAWCDHSSNYTAKLLIEAAAVLTGKAAAPVPPAPPGPAVADKGNAKDPKKPDVDKPPEKPKKRGPDDE